MITFASPPNRVDRLIVHQFDPARPSPGGIDTCLRGISAYFPKDALVAIVGVDTGAGPASRRVGQWELHETGGRSFWFLPAARLDPADQRRRVPHSVRLMAGLLRFRGRIPLPSLLQIHRMDSAAALRFVIKAPQVYFIHTQENGLTGTTSDSFWRFLGRAHASLERTVVHRAKTVVVFNEAYSHVVRKWNFNTHFSPTWYDPAIVQESVVERNAYRVLWVGRLETPKDPLLAVSAFNELVKAAPDAPWTLEVLGSGTLSPRVKAAVDALDHSVRTKVTLLGRVSPSEVALRMSESGVFLMTSHPGYEGYARVLVESMASGLVPVVTAGSDTGGLVVQGVSGYTTNRDPGQIAARIAEALTIDRADVEGAVDGLDAPTLINRIFDLDKEPMNIGEHR